MLRLIEDVSKLPLSAALDGIVFASEEALRELLFKRTNYRCGQKSIGRVLRWLHARGEIGRERVWPGQRLGPAKSTVHGGQHNWPLTRAEKRRARKRTEESQRQARHRAEQAAAAQERKEAAERAQRDHDAAIPYTAIVATMGAGDDVRERIAREGKSLAALERQRRVDEQLRASRTSDARDQELLALAAWDEAERRGRGRPPDE